MRCPKNQQPMERTCQHGAGWRGCPRPVVLHKVPHTYSKELHRAPRKSGHYYPNTFLRVYQQHQSRTMSWLLETFVQRQKPPLHQAPHGPEMSTNVTVTPGTTITLSTPTPPAIIDPVHPVQVTTNPRRVPLSSTNCLRSQLVYSGSS